MTLSHTFLYYYAGNRCVCVCASFVHIQACIRETCSTSLFLCPCERGSSSSSELLACLTLKLLPVAKQRYCSPLMLPLCVQHIKASNNGCASSQKSCRSSATLVFSGVFSSLHMLVIEMSFGIKSSDQFEVKMEEEMWWCHQSDSS